MRTLFIASIAALSLAACAETSSGPGGVARNGYADDMQKLQNDCETRGGILAANPRGFSGQASTDYYCDIHGGASRIEGPVGETVSVPDR